MVLPAKQAFLWLSWAHCYIFLSLYSRAGLLFLVQSLSLWCASYLIQDSLQNTFKAVAQRVCETKLLIENRLWYVLFQAGWAQFPAECWVCPGQNFSEGMLAVRYFWFLHSAVWAYVMAVLATSIGMTSFFSPTASRSLHVITYRTTISSCLVCPLIQPYLPQVLCLITALYCFVPALCFLQLYTILPLP